MSHPERGIDLSRHPCSQVGCAYRRAELFPAYALFAKSETLAERHLDDPLGALRSWSEIRTMARSPVMLTALAVVHWNERRIPEQRADLYESIIRWLSRFSAITILSVGYGDFKPCNVPSRQLVLLAELGAGFLYILLLVPALVSGISEELSGRGTEWQALRRRVGQRPLGRR